MIAVDARHQVRHANKAASVMLTAGNPVATRGGKVIFPGSSPATITLHEAISRAGRDESTLPGTGTGTGAGVPLRYADGRPAIAHVLPLRQGIVREGVGMGAAAAIFISTPSDSQYVPIDALAGLYGLTDAVPDAANRHEHRPTGGDPSRADAGPDRSANQRTAIDGRQADGRSTRDRGRRIPWSRTGAPPLLYDADAG